MALDPKDACAPVCETARCSWEKRAPAETGKLCLELWLFCSTRTCESDFYCYFTTACTGGPAVSAPATAPLVTLVPLPALAAASALRKRYVSAGTQHQHHEINPPSPGITMIAITVITITISPSQSSPSSASSLAACLSSSLAEHRGRGPRHHHLQEQQLAIGIIVTGTPMSTADTVRSLASAPAPCRMLISMTVVMMLQYVNSRVACCCQSSCDCAIFLSSPFGSRPKLHLLLLGFCGCPVFP